MPTRTRQHGFTIIELIVTMAILALMLFLVSSLFNDTSRAVTTSVQVSKTIAQSRSINEQLTQDLNAMIGPGVGNNGGYIVIVQHRITTAAMLDPLTLSEVPNPVVLRTDQLLFIRDAEGLKSMTPAGPDGYGTNLIGQAGDRAKVWYGHALRSLPNGNDPGATAAEYLGGADAKLDRFGNNFIFGRQAMLFNPANATTGVPISTAAAGYTYAAGGYYNSVVTGVAGYGGPAQTYMGLTDVTIQDYGPSTTAGTLLNQLANAATVANHNANYLATTYRVNANRLRVNPAPDPDATDYASWAIAQGHPILAQACSEIVIDFAADLNGDGEIDTEFGGQGANTDPIFWYDALRQPDLGVTALGQWDNPTTPAYLATAPQPLVVNNADKKIFVFRVDDDTPYTTTGTAVSSWPYLIRIRYRLHDMRGRLQSNNRAALRDGLDNDGDGDVDELAEDRISGRWFERIISVPRP